MHQQLNILSKFRGVRTFETIEYSTRFDSTRLDSIDRIANFRTCEYSNVSNYISKKSGKKPKSPKIGKSPEKSLEITQKNTNLYKKKILKKIKKKKQYEIMIIIY